MCGGDEAVYKVVSSPLVGILGGANVTIGSDGVAILDASDSYDPDSDPLGYLSFVWTCTSTSTGTPCVYVNSSRVALAYNSTKQVRNQALEGLAGPAAFLGAALLGQGVASWMILPI